MLTSLYMTRLCRVSMNPSSRPSVRLSYPDLRLAPVYSYPAPHADCPLYFSHLQDHCRPLRRSWLDGTITRPHLRSGTPDQRRSPQLRSTSSDGQDRAERGRRAERSARGRRRTTSLPLSSLRGLTCRRFRLDLRRLHPRAGRRLLRAFRQRQADDLPFATPSRCRRS